MGKGGGQQTTTQTGQALDPGSQAYVAGLRQRGGALGDTVANTGPLFTGPQGLSIGEQVQPFMNPYMQGVIDPMRAHFAQQRQMASRGVGDAAQFAGAFGGSRHGAMEGARLAGIDMNESQQIGNLMYGGYNNALNQGLGYAEQQRQLLQQQMQEPLFRAQQEMGIRNLGMGPTGFNTSTTETQPGGSRFGSAMSGGLAGFGAAGPWGALAGGLGGLFG